MASLSIVNGDIHYSLRASCYIDFHEYPTANITQSSRLVEIRSASAKRLFRFQKCRIRKSILRSIQSGQGIKGLELDGIGESTRQGYGAMVRLTLVWGSLESLVKALSATMDITKEFADRSDFSSLLAELRGFHDSQLFFKFVKKNLDNKRQAAEVDKFLQGQTCNCITLAKGVRHIFLHGLLSPGVQGSDPSVISEICDLLSECLFEIIDREFNAKAERLEAMFPIKTAPFDMDL